MIIENAKYVQGRDYDCAPNGVNVAINATIDGKHNSIPINDDNATYQEIMRQVEAGTLTIADAD